jgi:hypothetical protein
MPNGDKTPGVAPSLVDRPTGVGLVTQHLSRPGPGLPGSRRPILILDMTGSKASESWRCLAVVTRAIDRQRCQRRGECWMSARRGSGQASPGWASPSTPPLIACDSTLTPPTSTFTGATTSAGNIGGWCRRLSTPRSRPGRVRRNSSIQPFPGAIGRPATMPVVDGPPVAVVRRHVAPGKPHQVRQNTR